MDFLASTAKSALSVSVDSVYAVSRNIPGVVGKSTAAEALYADINPAVASAGVPGAVTAATSTAAYFTTANILPIVGFGTLGVKGCSAAALVQSTLYGAAVPAGGAFAGLTSVGMTGAVAAPLAVVAFPVAVFVGGASWVVVNGIQG